jgi:hypothetical protein
MEIEMERIALAFALALSFATSLAAPVAAQSMDVLLPTLTFPTDTVTPSTKGCAAQVTPVCQIAE